MSEIHSSPENLKIPGNWNFIWQDDPSLEIAQIDVDERFLAVKFPNKLKYADYFFDPKGYPLDHRIYDENINVLVLIGDSVVLYAIDDSSPRRDLSVDFLVNSPTDEDPTNSLGMLKYQAGDLYDMILQRDFIATNDQEDFIKSPWLHFNMRYRRWEPIPMPYSLLRMPETIDIEEKKIEGEIGSNYNFKQGKFMIQQTKGSNEATVFGANNEEVFRIKHSIQEDEVGPERRKVPFFCCYANACSN